MSSSDQGFPLPPSVVLAVLPAGPDALGVTEAQQALAGQSWIQSVKPSAEACCPRARWALDVELATDEDETLAAHAWLEPAPRQVRDGALGDEACDAITDGCCWTVGVSVLLDGPRPLWDFHRQLRLLGALVPHPVLVLDASASTTRPASWLANVLASSVPPAPTALYSVHAVHDDPKGPVWVHTHGLTRCGAIELELLDVPANEVETFQPLIDAVAAMFIEHGPPPPGEPFVAGRDLELVWRPWPEAARKVCGPGRAKHRDDAHCIPSGVLLAPKKGFVGRKLVSPTIYASVLRDNPMLYLSTMETERMGLLAMERLPQLRALFERHCERRDVRVLVKLGFPMDEGDETQREHLWFEVHGFDDERVDATLLNAPYHIAALNAGDRGHYPLSRLSDFAVVTSEGQHGPDRLPDLERTLDGGSAE